MDGRAAASISSSTAPAAVARSTPATAAVSAREASSPTIASARATVPTVAERRPSRAATKRATEGGPMAAIVRASRRVGSPPRCSSAAISWRTSSGFPAVVRAHSAHTASPVSPPRLPRTSSATAAGLSGDGRTVGGGSRSSSSVRASGADAASPVRTARIAQAGISSIRAAR